MPKNTLQYEHVQCSYSEIDIDLVLARMVWFYCHRNNYVYTCTSKLVNSLVNTRKTNILAWQF